MGRYVPRTYNNRRLLRITLGAVIFVAVAAVVLFVSLFFGLRKYMATNPDGTIQINPDGTVKLDVPFLMDE